MTEMKARLVDKDGNPLGTAANPLKISDHSISTATWGSITGTLSDQTDLNSSLTAKASSTSAALSILIYDGTPSSGDLSTYDEIYTTPALCFAALPAIINHAVTIKMRKADGSAYAAATLQRVVAGGSITIQGEYYYNNTVASAGSGTGKFNVIAAHSDLIQTGDKILLMKYSGTVGASRPTESFVDTVASVSGTEITLTTRTTDAFDTTWRYTVVRTELAGLTVTDTGIVRVAGLYINSSAGTALMLRNIKQCQVDHTVVNTTHRIAIHAYNASNHASYTLGWRYVAAVNSGSTLNAACLVLGGGDIFLWGQDCVFLNSGPWSSTYGGTIVGEQFYFQMTYGFIKTGVGCSYGVINREGTMRIDATTINGESSSYKMPVALNAIFGAKIIQTVTFGSNITTQKSPANWAATTDGSYIS